MAFEQANNILWTTFIFLVEISFFFSDKQLLIFLMVVKYFWCSIEYKYFLNGRLWNIGTHPNPRLYFKRSFTIIHHTVHSQPNKPDKTQFTLFT